MNTKVYEDDIKTHLEIADPVVPELDSMFRETLLDTLVDVYGVLNKLNTSVYDIQKKLDKPTNCKPKAKKEVKTIVKKIAKPLTLKSEKKPCEKKTVKPKGKKDKAAK
jgi:hypothetical protein